MKTKPWFALTGGKVLEYLKVDPVQGLNQREAENRLTKVGLNILKEEKKPSLISMFLGQFKDFMVLVLLGATLISFLLQEYSDALVIIVIVFLNACLGFFQEFKAEKSLDALKKLTAPSARVLRNRETRMVNAQDVVPGDIISLEAGDKVPADLRLLEVSNLAVDESALTGESEPINKNTAPLSSARQFSPGDLKNMVFTGTVITRGRGSGVVVATGMQTEMGKIAHMIQHTETEITPLQRRLASLGKILVAVCLVICAAVVALGILRGESVYKMFLAGVSLAVAAIPEGLPAVVTIALALGVQRMIKRKAIVRKLPAVETLGCATVICSDKTGTLTQNKMTVRQIYSGGNLYRVEGEGYDPHGKIFLGSREVQPKSDSNLRLLMRISALCSNARLIRGNVPIASKWRTGKISSWEIQGDPTEGALLAAAAKGGFWREDMEKRDKRIAELPFDSERKRMTVVYENSKKQRRAYTKGAPDVILSLCTHYYDNGMVRELNDSLKKEIIKKNSTLASQALRTLAFAYRELPSGSKFSINEKQLERELIYAGIMGMIDPPRPEVPAAVQKCKRAGIKTVMITGDHQNTALAIANSIGLAPTGGMSVTGDELNRLSDSQLEEKVDRIYVYARVSPAHKLRIVRALKNRGHVVAMTGDGINDAPAVKEADIGIAMGISGTDVTREAASLILADDNFSTIASAIEEGRNIYNNIRKFIRFLLSCNTGEIFTMFFALLIGLPLPLRPIQILWVNLVTDGLPAMALGVEPPEKGIMKIPPREKDEGIFARGLWQKILNRGSVIGFLTLVSFSAGLSATGDLERSRTMAFVTLILLQLFHVFDCRSEHLPFWKVSIRTNLALVMSVASSLAMLLAVIYWPFLQEIFRTSVLTSEEWFLVMVLSILPSLGTLLKSAATALFPDKDWRMKKRTSHFIKQFFR
ncbi:calcium-translocating P-type ATPase, SERCA-type [Candidatus Contubernalis alkaliaceticus]|uniref:calcium-translocating P-type ATPase, SERCA-type n=1 Tax=Candidatus Contubernalis alkaliaceticus TaxID=338645 RepID=UPI001F4C098A|nr:calcium-translocating P-type ATPase, SERCA-type [Candidatus Contubernalis alkalaceticus]UNC92793.1 calcium-translocating P-type ATPase, SERCA-type [Candidatus Contubernalis alkalaceticus]